MDHLSMHAATPEAFAHYCEGALRHTLHFLSLNLKASSNKINEVGARSLGYSSFDALQALWQRKDAIKQKMWAENCAVQNNRITVKAKNIVITFDVKANSLVGMSLRPGEEGRELTAELAGHDEIALLKLPEDFQLNNPNNATSLFNNLIKNTENPNLAPINSFISYKAKEDGVAITGSLLFSLTGKGIIVDLCRWVAGKLEIMDSIGMMFTDRQESIEGEERVDLVNHEPVFLGVDGIVYRWLRVDTDDNECDRLLAFEHDDGPGLSSLLFESPEKAIEAINSGQWDIEKEAIRDNRGVLVKSTQQLVKSPF